MIDLNLIKTLLRDQHRCYILQDMTGPVDINGGRTLEAKSRFVGQEESNESVAEAIAKMGKFIAFYEYDAERSVVRFEALN